ncbi:MAG: SRPBCC family protein [Pseudomonadota bacterium]
MAEQTLIASSVRIDGARYFDQSVMAAETERLWRRSWLLAGLASDLDQPGNTLVFDIGPDSIVVARDEAGLHAYHNVCTHRGTRLLDAGLSTQSVIRCPYHAWCYNLDGALRSAPNADTFTDGLPTERLRLKPVQVAEWQGFVFVNLDPAAAPLADFLGTVLERMAPYPIDRMVLLEDQTAEVDCNWKAIIDNFSELYHVDYIHPQHKSFVDCTGATDELYEHGHTGLHVAGFTTDRRYPVPDEPTEYQAAQLAALGLDPKDFNGRVPEIADAIAAAKRAQSGKQGYDYTSYSDEQLTRVYQYNLFPNIILSGTPEGLWMMRSRPHPTDPRKSLLDKWTLTLLPDPQFGGASQGMHTLHATSDGSKAVQAERVTHDRFHYSEVLAGRKSLTITVDQDLSLLAKVQAGAESAGFGEAWLSEREVRVAHFHQELNRVLAAGAMPAPGEG